jgi:hypothetical protein
MDVKQTLQHLEERLLTNAVRKDAREVSSLLVPEFREYGSSGRVYSKTEIIDQLQSEPSTNFSLKNFEIQHLSDQIVLVTYRAVKQNPGSLPVESLRSSIWVFRDERWQMLFHQGTKA